MIPWYWILIAGFVGFFLGIFAICIFIAGGKETEGPDQEKKKRKIKADDIRI